MEDEDSSAFILLSTHENNLDISYQEIIEESQINVIKSADFFDTYTAAMLELSFEDQKPQEPKSDYYSVSNPDSQH